MTTPSPKELAEGLHELADRISDHALLPKHRGLIKKAASYLDTLQAPSAIDPRSFNAGIEVVKDTAGKVAKILAQQLGDDHPSIVAVGLLSMRIAALKLPETVNKEEVK